jgi:uncharacterized protein (DUF427 family)
MAGVGIFASRPAPVPPGPGQESAWDYPRPPRLEPVAERLVVELGGEVIADTTHGYRVLETSHPPNYYFPPGDERDAAWGYDAPSPAFAAITGYLAFYASRMDACYVDGELVVPQEGGFYGGWITSRVVGPFKGAPGTRGW